MDQMERIIKTFEYDDFNRFDHCLVSQKLEEIRNGIVENVIPKQEMDKQFEQLFFEALQSPENNVKRLSFLELNMTNLSSYLTYFKSPNCKLDKVNCDVENFETLQTIVDFLANGFSILKRICLIDEMLGNEIDRTIYIFPPPSEHILEINYQGLLDQDQIKWINGVLDGPNCQLEIFASSFFEDDYSEKFYFLIKKRLLMVAISSARVGANSSLKRFPMELQRMLFTFL
jgi:hypothetical protein